MIIYPASLVLRIIIALNGESQAQVEAIPILNRNLTALHGNICYEGAIHPSDRDNIKVAFCPIGYFCDKNLKTSLSIVSTIDTN